MSFKNQKKPASLFKRFALLQQQITRETYGNAIRQVAQEILNRPPSPPGPAPASAPATECD